MKYYTIREDQQFQDGDFKVGEIVRGVPAAADARSASLKKRGYVWVGRTGTSYSMWVHSVHLKVHLTPVYEREERPDDNIVFSPDQHDEAYDHLRARGFTLNHITKTITPRAGVIKRPEGYKGETEIDKHAIDLLCQEYDYEYKTEPEKFDKDRLRKAMFTCFKPTGKYYSEGEGVLPEGFFLCDRTEKRQEILKHNGGSIPGLSGKGVHFVIVVTWLEEFNTAVPFMLPATI